MIVYIRANQRRDRFKIITTIEADSSGTLVSVKRAAHKTGEAHIKQVVRNYRLIKDSAIKYSTATVREDNDTAVFQYIDGKSHQTLFVEEIISREYTKAIDIIDNLFREIDRLEVKKLQKPTDNSDYATIFGTNYNTKVRCIHPAIVDLNLDNIISGKSGDYLIDYEWVFDFPVPIEYIKCRVLLNTFSQLADYMKQIPSRSEVIVSVGDIIYLPEVIYKKYEELLSGLHRVVATENSFQAYIRNHINTDRVDNIIKRYKIRRLRSPEFPLTITRLEDALQNLKLSEEARISMSTRLEAKELESRTLREELDKLKGSKSFKLASRVNKIVGRNK